MNPMKSDLLDRIQNQKAKIAIIGLGYVGLPLAVEYAKAKFPVKGIEVKKEVITAIQRGVSLVPDIKDELLIEATQKHGMTLTLVEEKYSNTKEGLKEEISECDVFLICVPTPLDHDNKNIPNLVYLERSVDIILDSLEKNKKSKNKEKLVILESTIYPGATEQKIFKAISKYGNNIKLAYSPERTNPGGTRKFNQITKIIGAINDESLSLAKAFYEYVFNSVFEVSSIKTAEVVKCAENSYRFISISLANKLAKYWQLTNVGVWDIFSPQEKPSVTLLDIFPKDILNNNSVKSVDDFFKMILEYNKLDASILDLESISITYLVNNMFYEVHQEKLDEFEKKSEIKKKVEKVFRTIIVYFFHQLYKFCIDSKNKINFKEVIEGILSKEFGLGMGVPGPGVGGHCIPIDPLYLWWRAHELNYNLDLLWESYLINEEMAAETVRLIRQSLHDNYKILNGSRILFLGVTYKENVPDMRESKALHILKALLINNARLYYCDPVFSKRGEELYIGDDDLKKREIKLKIPQMNIYNIHSSKTNDIPKFLINEKDIDYYIQQLPFDNIIKDIDKYQIDCIVVFCDHENFSVSFYEKLASKNNISIVDTRNAILQKTKKFYNNVTVIGYSIPSKRK